MKFAKHTASEQENAAVLPLAVRFVTQTYQDDLAAASGDGASGDGASAGDSAPEAQPANPESGAVEEKNNDRYAPVPEDKKEGE